MEMFVYSDDQGNYVNYYNSQCNCMPLMYAICDSCKEKEYL
jgi:hypothetical protein